MKRKQLLKSLHNDMCVCFSFFSRHPRSWAVASATEGSLCLTRFCSCPRLYKNARRKQHTEMRHIAVSRPDLWQLVPRLLSVSCVCVGGGALCSFSPLPLCLPTPALHCVAPVFRLIKRIRNPGLTFKLCQNLIFMFIFWPLLWLGYHWFPIKVTTGQFS